MGSPSFPEEDDAPSQNVGGAAAGPPGFALTIRPSDPVLSRLEPRDEALLRISFDKAAYLHRFVLGPEHANSLLRHISVSLNTSPGALLKISLACSGRFSSKFRLSPHPDTSRDYENCARAVQSLREMADATSIGAPGLVAMLALGLGIVTFDLFETGVYAHSICRNTLTLADRHLRLSGAYPGQEAAITGDLGANLVPLVIMDTYNCLVRRQVPVIRLQLGDAETVDKYIGVCWPLLPHLYDICCLSHRLSSLSPATPGGQLGTDLRLDIGRELNAVETAVFSWRASIPPGTLGSSSAREIEILEIQAEVYRRAILLIIHRLRHPLGSEDETAREWSGAILAGIERLFGVAAQAHDGLAAPVRESNFDYRLALPFFVAAVEVADLAGRDVVLGKLGAVVSGELYHHVLRMMRRAIVSTWNTRDEGGIFYLFDILSEGPDFVLL